MSIEFHVRGLPVPQGSSKAFPMMVSDGKGGKRPKAVLTNQTPKLAAWRQAIADEARKVAPAELITSPLCVTVAFEFDRPKSQKNAIRMKTRPDLDKLVRAVLDGCTNVIWKDDSQVDELHAFKRYGVPGVHVSVVSEWSKLVDTMCECKQKTLAEKP